MKPVMERKGEGQRQAKAIGEPGRSTRWRKGGPLIRSLSVQCKNKTNKLKKKRRRQWCLFKIQKSGAMRKRMYFNKTVIIILYIIVVSESTFKTCMCITIASGF